MGNDLTGDVLRRATVAFRRGAYDECLAITSGYSVTEQRLKDALLLLRSRITIRRDPTAAVEMLAREVDAMSSERAAEGHMVLGAAYLYVGQPSMALAYLHEARRLAAEDDVALISENAYYLCLERWMARDFDPRHGQKFGIDLDRSAIAVGRALHMRAWMYGGLENYPAQVTDLIASLDAFRRDDDPDAYWIAATLQPLSDLAFEVWSPAAAEYTLAVLQEFTWPSERSLQSHHYRTIRALAHTAQLQGDDLRAQLLFKEAEFVAPSPAWRCISHLDRASVAYRRNNLLYSAEELHYAQAIEREVTWGSTRGEERIALLQLAALTAPNDPVAAQTYLMRFHQIAQSLAPTLGLAHDRRLAALEDSVTGEVLRALGKYGAAEECFLRAYRVHDDLGYSWRAAKDSINLLSVTGNERWIIEAERNLKHYPASHVATALATIKSSKQMPSMSTALKEVLTLACSGLNKKQIADKRNVSPATVNNQFRQLYEILEVHSHAALIARAISLGFSGDAVKIA